MELTGIRRQLAFDVGPKNMSDSDVNDFTELYQIAAGPKSILAEFISGHLVVEFLLRKLIQIYDPALTSTADGLNHARLIALNHDIGTITEVQKNVLTKINSIRNKFAHRITYVPTIADLKALYQDAQSAFNDLSDGISQGREELDKAQSIDDLEEWVIPELFIQISYDLHDIYHSRGGDIEEF